MKAEFYPRTDKEKLFRAWVSRKTIGSLAGEHGGPGNSPDLFFIRTVAESLQPLEACTSPKDERFEDGTIDFGTGYHCFDVLANTSNALVGGMALHNRQILKSYMEGAGFRSYAKEWWHFKLINEPFNRDGFDFEVSTSPSSNERPTR